jgi:hypothetical protein
MIPCPNNSALEFGLCRVCLGENYHAQRLTQKGISSLQAAGKKDARSLEFSHLAWAGAGNGAGGAAIDTEIGPYCWELLSHFRLEFNPLARCLSLC